VAAHESGFGAAGSADDTVSRLSYCRTKCRNSIACTHKAAESYTVHCQSMVMCESVKHPDTNGSKLLAGKPEERPALANTISGLPHWHLTYIRRQVGIGNVPAQTAYVRLVYKGVFRTLNSPFFDFGPQSCAMTKSGRCGVAEVAKLSDAFTSTSWKLLCLMQYRICTQAAVNLFSNLK
jgi:hypothetical protein